MKNVLECKGLSKRYGRLDALNGIDIALPAGRIVGLLGPNGSGKTTLIKLAAGLLTPTSGEIFICGNKPGIVSKSMLSYLPDRDSMPGWMSIEDMLKYFSDFYTDFDMAKSQDMLSRLKIDSSQKVKSLSKGTREKVHLVLIMSRRARLYLLDEPIGGVDPASRDYILETIISNYSENATVLISTHLIADIEKVLEEVIFINGGYITLQSTVDDIRATHGKSVDELFREVFRC